MTAQKTTKVKSTVSVSFLIDLDGIDWRLEVKAKGLQIIDCDGNDLVLISWDEWKEVVAQVERLRSLVK